MLRASCFLSVLFTYILVLPAPLYFYGCGGGGGGSEKENVTATNSLPPSQNDPALYLALLSNGDFESQWSAWTATSASASVSFGPNEDNTSNVLAATQRSAATAGIEQDISAQLQPLNASGIVRTQFWIITPAVVSARAKIVLTDDAGARTLYLAERTVLTTDDWQKVNGVTSISWTGTLQSAIVQLEVLQTAERLYPDYLIDNLSIETDADGDSLSDLEEIVLMTDPNDADSDADEIPDDWESAHNLNPLMYNKDEDADGDGFSNHEEYWAASDPQNQNQYPGKPSNANSSNATKAVLNYLATLPAQTTNRVVIGQHITVIGQGATEYNDYVAALDTLTGKEFGILMLAYDLQNNGFDIQNANQEALAYWQKGGLVQIKWSPSNPWTSGSANDLSQVDMAGLLDPANSLAPNENLTAQQTFIAWLDQVADGLEELKNAGVVVLWRPMSEMNGAWFWWGRQTHDEYANVWQYMHTYFSDTRGLDNLIWVYESDSATHLMNASDYYYPGDDYVDVMGHNLYNDTWTLAWDVDRTYRQFPKVHAIPQAGSATIRDGSWDNLVYLDGLKNRFPRVSYFGSWNSFYKGNTYVVRAIVDNLNVQALVDDPWMVTLDKLPAH